MAHDISGTPSGRISKQVYEDGAQQHAAGWCRLKIILRYLQDVNKGLIVAIRAARWHH